MSDQPPVRLDVDADGIAAPTLNRPEQLNAFDLNMIETWRAALEAAEAAERVRVVVTGAGRAVCAGGDFEELAKFSETNSPDRETQSATPAETCIDIGLIAGDAGWWFLPRLIPARRLPEPDHGAGCTSGHGVFAHDGAARPARTPRRHCLVPQPDARR